jgi:hypothetical protein
MSVKVEEFKKYLDENQDNGWVNFEIKKSREGKHYIELNTWKPNQNAAQNNQGPANQAPPPTEDFPF